MCVYLYMYKFTAVCMNAWYAPRGDLGGLLGDSSPFNDVPRLARFSYCVGFFADD